MFMKNPVFSFVLKMFIVANVILSFYLFIALISNYSPLHICLALLLLSIYTLRQLIKFDSYIDRIKVAKTPSLRVVKGSKSSGKAFQLDLKVIAQ